MKRRLLLKSIPTLCLAGPAFLSCRTSKSVPGEEWRTTTRKRVPGGEKEEDLLRDARRRIPVLRTGKLQLRFFHGMNPIPESEFEIRHIRHEFGFGTTHVPSSSANARFEPEGQSLMMALNRLTARCYWDEKWHQPIESTEGKRDYSLFEEEIAFGQRYGLEVKGHPLIWTVDKALPKWLRHYPVGERLNKLLDHAGDLVIRYKDRIRTWDLANEFLWEPSLNHTEQRVWPHLETIPEILTYLEPGIKHIRRLDPGATLLLNEYGLEKDFAQGVTATQQRNRYLELVSEMKKRDCAPDALGTQCHVGEPFTMAEIQTTLDDLSQAGLPLHVTEFWARENHGEHANAREETLDYIRNAYTLIFAHPSAQCLTYWGGDLFQSGRPGPKGKVVLDLLTRVWTTRESFRTDGAGRFSVQGYFGDYQVLQNGNVVGRFSFSAKEKDKILEIRV